LDGKIVRDIIGTLSLVDGENGSPLSSRPIKKTGHQNQEEDSLENWINLTRSHWARVENRKYYRRGATLGEDFTRCSNPNLS